MKKIVTLVLFGATLASAQITVGGKAGLNSAGFTSGSGEYIVSDQFGVNAGGFLAYEPTPIYGALLEGSYTQKGALLRPNSGSASFGVFDKSEWTLEYFEMALTARAKLPVVEEKLFALAFAGPTLGLLVDGVRTDEYADGSESESSIKHLTSADWGFTLGGGLSIPAAQSGVEFFVVGGYTYAFADIDDESVAYDFRNVVFNVSAGVSYSLRR
jgi:hypothetical protein